MLIRQAGLSRSGLKLASVSQPALHYRRYQHISTFATLRTLPRHGTPSIIQKQLALRSTAWRQLPIASIAIGQLRRNATATGPAPKRNIFLRYCYSGLAYFGFFILAGGAAVAAFFAYDASTYKESPFEEEIHV